MALTPWCHAARDGLVRLMGRVRVDVGTLSNTAAVGDHGMTVLERLCSALEEGRWHLPWRLSPWVVHTT